MNESGYSIEDLMKAAQASAEDETRKDEEKEEKKKTEAMKEESKEEVEGTEETKTSSLNDLAAQLRLVSNWITKTAGEVPVEPPVTGEQPHPTPHPTAEQDATAEKPLGEAGAVGNTETDPLTTQQQAQPAQTTADQTGKTSSGPAKSQPLAADGAKVAEIGAWLRNKIAATPVDTAAAPMSYPTGSGEVGGSEPTDKVPELSGDAAASNMTAQQAENRTWKPDMAPLLSEKPENHAESGDGAPVIEPKLDNLEYRIRKTLDAGGV